MGALGRDNEIGRQTGESDYVLIAEAREYVSHRQARNANATFERAWREFFALYDPMIRRLVAVLAAPPSDLDGCVQAVWQCVLEDLPGFQLDQRKGRFRNWLYTRVKGIAIDMIRRQSCRPEFPVGVAGGALDSACGRELEPYEACVLQWRELVLQETLQALQAQVNDVNYRVFVMRKLHELSTAEVAHELEISQGHVRKRLSRTMAVFGALVRRFGGREVFFKVKQ